MPQFAIIIQLIKGVPTMKLASLPTFDRNFLLAIVVAVVFGGILLWQVSVSSSDNATYSEVSTETLEKLSNEDSDISFRSNDSEQAEPEDSQTTTSVTSSSETTTTITTSSGNESISFTKGGEGVQGTNVVISLTASGELNGQCSFVFTLGNSKVEKSNSADTKSCNLTTSVNEFSKTGAWNYVATYKSNDGTISFSSNGTINIFPEEFFFTKGGRNFDGSSATFADISAEPHTGICNYTFSLGNYEFSESSMITNSRTCDITIPGSEFPELGTWTFTLVFNGTTEYVVGKTFQSGEIDIY